VKGLKIRSIGIWFGLGYNNTNFVLTYVNIIMLLFASLCIAINCSTIMMVTVVHYLSAFCSTARISLDALMSVTQSCSLVSLLVKLICYKCHAFLFTIIVLYCYHIYGE